jgi:hypothetical protein
VRGQFHKFNAKPYLVTPDLQLIAKETVQQIAVQRGISLETGKVDKRQRPIPVSLVRLGELVGIDGAFFGSKREASRWVELKLAERGGKVRNLKRAPRYPLHVVNPQGLKVRVSEYTGDFEYDELLEADDQAVRLFNEPVGWQHVIEESKGFPTKDWELRKKWVETEHGIVIRVT